MAEEPSTRERRRPRRLRPLALAGALVAVLIPALPGTASAATGQVVPVLNCHYAIGDGSIIAVFGYRSTYSNSQKIAVGTRNYMTPSTYSASLPTTFKTGTNDGVFSISIAAADVSSTSWYLDGTTLAYADAAPGVGICGQTPLPAFANGAALTTLLLAAGLAGALVVRRARPTTSATRSNGSARALGGDHA